MFYQRTYYKKLSLLMIMSVLHTQTFSSSCGLLRPVARYSNAMKDKSLLPSVLTSYTSPDLLWNAQQLDNKDGSFSLCFYTQENDHLCTLHTKIWTDLIAFNDNIIATTMNKCVHIWNHSSECIVILQHPGPITAIALSNDETKIASAYWDRDKNQNFITIWDIKSQKEIHTFEQRSPIQCLTFSPQGTILAIGCWDNDKNIQIIDVGSGYLLSSIACNYPATSIIFSQDGSEITVRMQHDHTKISFEALTCKFLRVAPHI